MFSLLIVNRGSVLGRKKVFGLTEEEERMLDLLMKKDTSLVAIELGKSEAAIYQALYRIRKRVEEAQNLVNKINNYKIRSPRLRKLLTVGRPVERKRETKRA